MRLRWRRSWRESGGSCEVAVVLRPTERNIGRAARALLAGGHVAFPTETVYGLGAVASDAEAVAAVFERKGRPRNDPLILHLAGPEMLESVAEVPRRLEAVVGRLARRFWPGPLTLVLPKAETVPAIVTAGLPTVAVRVPDHRVALRLLRRTGVALAAPSANRFGEVSPVTARHVEEGLGKDVLVLDGGRCRVGVESTILDLTGRMPTVLRYGGVPVEVLERLLGKVGRPSGRRTAVRVPGQFPKHYAPRTPLRLLAEGERPSGGERECLLFWRRPRGPVGRNVRWLTESGDDEEAARNLYAVLHRVDTEGFDRILAELPPSEGLGLAVRDRLRRASAGRNQPFL